MKVCSGDRTQPGGKTPYLLTLITTLILFPGHVIAQKTDTIIFKNGDQLTVDIKEFERGRLRASTYLE